jgi:hypothetical protein
MKRTSIYPKLLIVVIILMMTTPVWAESNVDWNAFSKNLQNAMFSENPGLQQSAMCMMVQYGSSLNIDRGTVFEIVRVFRSHKNENVRLLAMMALYNVEDSWAMDYLKRHNSFEKQGRVKRLCHCAVQTYYAKMDSIKNSTILVNAENRVIAMHSAKADKDIDLEQFGF